MKNKEINIQSAIIAYLRLNNILCFSVPNGTNIKSVATRAIMKRTGLMSGVSDIVLVLGRRVVFVEVKTPSGKLSPTQQAFKRCIEGLGHEWHLWRSVEDAEKFVRELSSIS